MTIVRAEVSCLNCGRFLGEIESTGERLRIVRSGSGGVTPRVVSGRLRCGRCGGRALVEPSENQARAA